MIGLVSAERLARQRPKQSVHLALVITHLLQLGLHIRDHLVRRLSAVTYIDWSIVSVVSGRRVVPPCRIPITVTPIIITATDQHDSVILPSVPSLIVPFWMIRPKHFILGTLPMFRSLNAMVRAKCNRRNSVGPWLGLKICVLLFDCLHLVRVRLPRIPIRARIGLINCRRGCRLFGGRHRSGSLLRRSHRTIQWAGVRRILTANFLTLSPLLGLRWRTLRSLCFGGCRATASFRGLSLLRV